MKNIGAALLEDRLARADREMGKRINTFRDRLKAERRTEEEVRLISRKEFRPLFFKVAIPKAPVGRMWSAMRQCFVGKVA